MFDGYHSIHFVYCGANQITDKQEDMIFSITNNEIIVSNYAMGAYFDENAEALGDDDLFKINAMNDIDKIMPFSVIKAEYHGIDIVIKPYTQ